MAREYTDQQRAAIVAADGRYSGPEIVELAAKGMLRTESGDRLEPFTITSPNTVRAILRRARRRAVAATIPESQRVGPDGLTSLSREILEAHRALPPMRPTPNGSWSPEPRTSSTAVGRRGQRSATTAKPRDPAAAVRELADRHGVRLG